MKSTAAVLRYYAAHTPARPAVVSARIDWSYGELLDAAAAIAKALERDRTRVLALAADNGPAWIAADLAAQIAGITLVPLPPYFSKEQVRHAVENSGAEGVLADRTFCREIATAFAESEAAIALPKDLFLYRLPSLAAAQPGLQGVAKISYTSGTTGNPKGVRLAQSAMDSVAQSLWAATAELDLGKHLCLLPLATLLENVAGVYAPLRNGASIAVPGLREIGLLGSSGLDVARFVRCIAEHRPHSVILLPQTLAALVVALESGAPRLDSLRFAAVGGARVPEALLERAQRVGLPVYEGYGLTECASVVALNQPGARRAGSVGRVLPHARVRIDERSEIHVSGAAVCGYGPGETVPEDVATGDLGRLDADGFLYVTGRRKNVFITSFGRNVSPDWVEAELTRAPPIAQAALFGESRPWNVAVVVAPPMIRAHEIQRAIDSVNRDLPDYARVRDWLRADEPFTPGNGQLTPNGRNRRAAIWNKYRERIDSCYFDSIAV
jgi:long-subunit acyl-CoA synthetase (AMP-forming)